jgi:hypothetical protein
MDVNPGPSIIASPPTSSEVEGPMKEKKRAKERTGLDAKL